MTDENYFSDLRDAYLYIDCATLEKPSIPPQRKLYLADQGHYVAGLQSIDFQLEKVGAIPIWRPIMDEDASTA